MADDDRKGTLHGFICTALFLAKMRGGRRLQGVSHRKTQLCTCTKAHIQDTNMEKRRVTLSPLPRLDFPEEAFGKEGFLFQESPRALVVK